MSRTVWKVVTNTATVACFGGFTQVAAASHSWSTHHWARAATPFTLQLDNNLTTTQWQQIGGLSSVDWTTSSVMDAPLGDPKTDNKRCKPSSGRVETCNGKYGYNGWLGLAQVWLSGGHIVQAVAKMNDSYLASTRYSPANKQHVLCQEIGHTFGLDHQDESGADLNTCMDYANLLDNPSPNDHDLEQLETIYLGHQDSTSTVEMATTSQRSGLQRVREDLWVEDLGNGQKRFVWVFWKDRDRLHGRPAEG